MIYRDTGWQEDLNKRQDNQLGWVCLVLCSDTPTTAWVPDPGPAPALCDMTCPASPEQEYLLGCDAAGNGLLHALAGHLCHHHVGEAIEHLGEEGDECYLQL